VRQGRVGHESDFGLALPSGFQRKNTRMKNIPKEAKKEQGKAQKVMLLPNKKVKLLPGKRREGPLAPKKTKLGRVGN